MKINIAVLDMGIVQCTTSIAERLGRVLIVRIPNDQRMLLNVPIQLGMRVTRA